MDKSGKNYFLTTYSSKCEETSSVTITETKFVKRSEQRDYLNRIEMKKNEPINMIIENKGCQTVFFCKRTNDIEVKAQNLLHRKQTNLGPLRKLCYFMIGLFRS